MTFKNYYSAVQKNEIDPNKRSSIKIQEDKTNHSQIIFYIPIIIKDHLVLDRVGTETINEVINFSQNKLKNPFYQKYSMEDIFIYAKIADYLIPIGNLSDVIEHKYHFTIFEFQYRYNNKINAIPASKYL
jgi:hypothetical protein